MHRDDSILVDTTNHGVSSARNESLSFFTSLSLSLALTVKIYIGLYISFSVLAELLYNLKTSNALR